MDHNTTTPTAWQESDSELFLSYGRVFTPARDAIAQVLLDLLPARQDEPFVFVDIGAGQGWLSEAVLQRFPMARAIVLDGSPTMLERAGALLAPFAGRVELRQFRLEEGAWRGALGNDVRCFLSSLAIHHLDGPQKRALFADLFRHLAPGGALLIADVIAPASELERQHIARAWDAAVRRQALELTGDLRAYEVFVADRWNIYDHPDPVDKPSTIFEQLHWLEEAGFTGVSVFWAQAGHAVFGGYKSRSET